MATQTRQAARAAAATPARTASRAAAGRNTTPRIALALAGGGPLGAIYEIGALCALEQSLTGLDLNLNNPPETS